MGIDVHRGGRPQAPQDRRLRLATAVVLATTVSIGRWHTAWPIELALATALIVASTLVPTLGLAALIAASLASPLSVGTGTETDLNLVLLLVPPLGVVWLVRAGFRRDVNVLNVPAVRALGAFLAVALLAFAGAHLSWLGLEKTAPLAAQLGQLAVFAFSAGIFTMAADWICDLRSLARLTWLFLGLGGILVAGRAMPELRTLGVPDLPPGADGSLFWIWMVALAFGQAAFNRDLDWRLRSLLGFLVYAALHTGLVLTPGWISGWLPALIAVLAALCIGTPRFAFFLAAIGAVSALMGARNVIDFLAQGGNPYSLDTRLDAWRIMGRIVAEHPLLGLGPANYYHLTPSFPIRGYAVHFSSHNNYVDILAQTGILGLACFVWFTWEVGRAGWKLRNRIPGGFARGYLYGALGGLAGTLAAGVLCDWFLPFVYNVTLAGFRASSLGWLFLGGLIALGRIVASSSSSETARAIATAPRRADTE